MKWGIMYFNAFICCFFFPFCALVSSSVLLFSVSFWLGKTLQSIIRTLSIHSNLIDSLQYDNPVVPHHLGPSVCHHNVSM